MKKAFVAALGFAGLVFVGVFGMLACQQADTVAPQIADFTVEETGTGPSYVWADSIKGTVLVSVSATDNVGVDKVIFFVNDMDSIGVGEPLTKPDSLTSTYQYKWDTKLLQDSVRYSICARVYDAAGNVTKSEVKSYLVRVPNSPPDTADVLAPVTEDSTQYARITFQWIGSDPDVLPSQLDKLTYDVYLDTNGNSSSNLIKVNTAPIPNRDTTTWATGQLQNFYLRPETYYYWRVVTIDPYGKTTPTQILRFKRSTNTQPAGGTPSLPADTSEIFRPQGDSLQLRWSLGDPDSDRVKVDIYFGPDPGTAIKASDLPMIASNYDGVTKWVKLTSDTAYAWRVVGRDMWGLSRDSSVLDPWKFKVKSTK